MDEPKHALALLDAVTITALGIKAARMAEIARNDQDVALKKYKVEGLRFHVKIA